MKRNAACSWIASFVAPLLAVALLAAMLLTSSLGLSQTESGILRNGDFIAGMTSWWGKGDGHVALVDGQPALKLTDGFVAQDKMKTEGGKNYRLALWIRADGASENSIFVQASARGPGVGTGWIGAQAIVTNGHAERAVVVTGGTHGWRQFVATVTTPPSANQLLIYLRKQPGTAGAAVFRSVELVATSEPAVSPMAVMRRKLVDTYLAPAGSGDAARMKDQMEQGRSGPSAYLAIEKSKVAALVHVGDDEDVITLAAAASLSNYFGQMTGTEPRRLSSDTAVGAGPLIIIGSNNVLVRGLMPPGALKDLSDDGFVIKTYGRHIIITGRTPRGTMYGVNWFLDRQAGVKWLASNFTFVPHPATLLFKTIDTRQNPRFVFRELLNVEAQNKAWRQHNLLNGESHGPAFSGTSPDIDSWNRSWETPGTTKSFFALLPPRQYQGLHPDWYAGGQLAMMNTAMRGEMARRIISDMRKLQDYRSVWYSVKDQDWGWDLDPASQKFADLHGGVASAPRLDMMVDVANQVRAVLPGARLAFNAYHWSFAPPAGMKVPDYLMVIPMTIQVNYAQALNEAGNADLAQSLQGWNNIADTILVWDHVANFSGFIQPTPNILPIARSIKWLATLPHVRGYFAEGSWNTPGAEFSSLRSWIMSRLLWDPHDDVDAAVLEFTNHFYGPAAPFIREYFYFYHQQILTAGDRLTEKAPVTMKMFDGSFMLKSQNLFDKAQAAARGTIYAQHVREARIPVDYVLLSRRETFAAQAAALGIATSAQVSARTQDLLAAIKEAGIRQYYQGGGVATLAERLAIDRRMPAAPQLDGRVPKTWRDIQDLSFNLYGNAKIVADPEASDGGAAMLDSSNAGWNVQLKPDQFPKTGKWNIYVSIKVEGNDGTDAARLGSAPPMNCFARVSGNGHYEWVKVPGGPFAYSDDHAKSLYVVAVPSKALKRRIFIDRFVLSGDVVPTSDVSGCQH